MTAPRRWFSLAAKWMVSLLALVFLCRAVNVHEVVEIMRTARVDGLALAVAISVLSIVLAVWRWHVALRVQGLQVNFRQLFSSTLVAGFVGFWMPTFAQDAVRGIDLYRAESSGVSIAASILFERLCGLLGHVAVGTLALVLWQDRLPSGVVRAAGMVYLAVAVALCIVFLPALGGLAEKVCQRVPWLQFAGRTLHGLSAAILAYRRRPLVWVRVLGISLVFQLVGCAYYYVIARALHQSVNYTDFVLLIPLVTILSLIPVSVSGLGVKEGLFVLLFTQLGQSVATALSVAAVGTVLYFVIVLWGGAVFWMRRGNPSPSPFVSGTPDV